MNTFMNSLAVVVWVGIIYHLICRHETWADKIYRQWMMRGYQNDI